MGTVALSEATFARTVHSHDIVLIDFWAAWCGPCRTFGPVYDRASRQHPDIVFAKVDTETEPDLASAFNVTSIPTLMAIREGVVLYAQAGALPEHALAQLIQAVRDVDMDEVRASVGAEEGRIPAPAPAETRSAAPSATDSGAPADAAAAASAPGGDAMTAAPPSSAPGQGPTRPGNADTEAAALTRHCPGCGQAAAAAVRFCVYCGAPLTG